jgi:heparanase
MAINTSRTRPQSIDLATAADRYTLTAQKLDSARVRLNGHELGVMADGELPSLPGRSIPPGHVELAPASITFLAVTEAANESCR